VVSSSFFHHAANLNVVSDWIEDERRVVFGIHTRPQSRRAVILGPCRYGSGKESVHRSGVCFARSDNKKDLTLILTCKSRPTWGLKREMNGRVRVFCVNGDPQVRRLVSEASYAVREAFELFVPQRLESLGVEVNNGSMLAGASLDHDV
jgi:hypothetical protein